METLGRADYRGGERGVACAIGVTAEPIIGEWVNMVWRTHVRDGRRREPFTGSRKHTLRGMGVLQSPLKCPVAIINEVRGGQPAAPPHWLRLEEADVRVVLHPIGVRQLGMGLHGDVKRRGLLELAPGP